MDNPQGVLPDQFSKLLGRLCNAIDLDVLGAELGGITEFEIWQERRREAYEKAARSRSNFVPTQFETLGDQVHIEILGAVKNGLALLLSCKDQAVIEGTSKQQRSKKCAFAAVLGVIGVLEKAAAADYPPSSELLRDVDNDLLFGAYERSSEQLGALIRKSGVTDTLLQACSFTLSLLKQTQHLSPSVDYWCCICLRLWGPISKRAGCKIFGDNSLLGCINPISQIAWALQSRSAPFSSCSGRGHMPTDRCYGAFSPLSLVSAEVAYHIAHAIYCEISGHEGNLLFQREEVLQVLAADELLGIMLTLTAGAAATACKQRQLAETAHSSKLAGRKQQTRQQQQQTSLLPPHHEELLEALQVPAVAAATKHWLQMPLARVPPDAYKYLLHSIELIYRARHILGTAHRSDRSSSSSSGWGAKPSTPASTATEMAMIHTILELMMLDPAETLTRGGQHLYILLQPLVLQETNRQPAAEAVTRAFLQVLGPLTVKLVKEQAAGSCSTSSAGAAVSTRPKTSELAWFPQLICILMETVPEGCLHDIVQQQPAAACSTLEAAVRLAAADSGSSSTHGNWAAAMSGNLLAAMAANVAGPQDTPRQREAPATTASAGGVMVPPVPQKELFLLLATCTKIAKVAAEEEDRPASKASAAATGEDQLQLAMHVCSSMLRLLREAPMDWLPLQGRCLQILGSIVAAVLAGVQSRDLDLSSRDTPSSVLGLLRQIIETVDRMLVSLQQHQEEKQPALPPGNVAAVVQAYHQVVDEGQQLLKRLEDLTLEQVRAAISSSESSTDPYQAMVMKIAGFHPLWRQSLRQVWSVDLADQLQQFGAAVEALQPLPLWCNNPGCVNLSRASEVEVVSVKGSRCGGCQVARYCCKGCQLEHWKRHKHTCKILAASRVQQPC